MRLVQKKLGTRILILSILFSAGACITPAREKRMQQDIFTVQTRLLTLEQKVNGGEAGVQAVAATRQDIASTSNKMDQIQQDVNKLKGDVDALRVGVVTGQMPGEAEPPREGSVASQLKDIITRLEQLETNQAELMAAIEKGGKGDDKKGKKSKSEPNDLKGLFQKKQYDTVIDEAPKLLKKYKGKNKSDIYYYYAESLFKTGKHREAALKFNDFIENGAPAKQVPHAKMRMGDCFKVLGDPTTAKLYYEEVVEKYPKSEEASKAKEQLSKLNKSH